MNRWQDGIERNPDGVVRQIPQRHAWSSGVWITRRGIARRRFYNRASKTWHWDDEPCPLVVNEDTLGLHLDWWISIERAIALAWVRRAPESSSHVTGEALHAKHIAWAINEADDEGAPLPGETWRPLNWSCGAVRCDRRYQISSDGWLRSPYTGKVTRGFWFDHRRWAAVKGAGLVDLAAAARRRPAAVQLPPAIGQALDALALGYTPANLAEAALIEVGTAWSYFCRAAQHVPRAELRHLTPALVSGDLWRALARMRGDPVVGGPLLALMEAVRRALPSDGEFRRSEHQMAQLRLARMSIAVS